MDWNEETIGRLRSLWAEGHSTAEIGRRLGVSKNAVVGKAHRLNLPARPSPIRRGLPGTLARAVSPRRVTGPTLPPLPGPSTPALMPGARIAAMLTGAAVPSRAVTARAEPAASAPRVAQAEHAVSSPQRSAPAETPAARAVPSLRPVAPARASSRLSACCWPIGEPGKPSFRFCDGEAITGKPYCVEHAQLAYVKIRDRREEAA